MGLSDGRKKFPIRLAVLIQYRSVTDTQPPSHVAVAITLNAQASSLKMNRNAVPVRSGPIRTLGTNRPFSAIPRNSVTRTCPSGKYHPEYINTLTETVSCSPFTSSKHEQYCKEYIFFSGYKPLSASCRLKNEVKPKPASVVSVLRRLQLRFDGCSTAYQRSLRSQ